MSYPYQLQLFKLSLSLQPSQLLFHPVCPMSYGYLLSPLLILQLHSSIAHLLSLIYPLSLVPYPESKPVIYHLSSYLIPCHLVSSTVVIPHHSVSSHLTHFLVSHHQLFVIGCHHSWSNSSSTSYLRRPTQSYLALHFLISLK